MSVRSSGRNAADCLAEESLAPQGAQATGTATITLVIGVDTIAHGQQASLNLRGYKEFGARDRLEGKALFANVSIPIGSAGK